MAGSGRNRSVGIGRVAAHVGAGLLAAGVLVWPAIYNRYPLLYPDSISYISDASNVVHALFQRDFTDYYGFRSLIYGLGILPLHWHITPWPIVVVNALLTSYVLWFLVRLFFPEHLLVRFLAITLALSLFTGIGWQVGWVMPDILGPLAYLSVFFLISTRERLRVSERVVLTLIAWWGIVSHSTHLLLTLGLCLLLVLVLFLKGRSLRQSLRAVGPVAAALLVAALVQVALNAYLDQGPSLYGNHPPYLLARVLADGPGRWYLQKQCGNSSMTVCDQLKSTSDDAEEFLWGEQGWANASTAVQGELRREEMTVVLGTLHDYPQEELRISAAHFWEQLLSYGLYSYDPNPWVVDSFDWALPGRASAYLGSRQAQGKLAVGFFSSLQHWAVAVSLVVIVLWVVFGHRRWSRNLVGLTVIVTYVILANAAVTACASNVEDRYQARVIWLVPLLSLVFLLTWLDHRFSQPTKSARVP